MSFKILLPKDDKEWLELRQKAITATEVGVILGLNKWRTIKDIYQSKQEINQIDNSYVWLGQQLEPVVVQAVNKMTGSNFQLFPNKTFYFSEELGLGATPDAAEGNILLECKTTKPANYLRWAYIPPAYYLVQLYTQMIATNAQVGLLGILSTDLTQHSDELNLDLSIFSMVRCSNMDDVITTEVKRFWNCYRDGKMFRRNIRLCMQTEVNLYLLAEKVL